MCSCQEHGVLLSASEGRNYQLRFRDKGTCAQARVTGSLFTELPLSWSRFRTAQCHTPSSECNNALVRRLRRHSKVERLA